MGRCNCPSAVAAEMQPHVALFDRRDARHAPDSIKPALTYSRTVFAERPRCRLGRSDQARSDASGRESYPPMTALRASRVAPERLRNFT